MGVWEEGFMALGFTLGAWGCGFRLAMGEGGFLATAGGGGEG